MAEQTCINYLNKVYDIKTLCDVNTTTKALLEVKINELMTITNQFELELTTMNIPVTMGHMDVFILTRVEMMRKSTIQTALLKLQNLRDITVKAMMDPKTMDIQQIEAIKTENSSIENYVETVINNCACMSERRDLIKKISKK